MTYIETHNLTKDYGNGRGIFDVSLSVEQGEVFGFVGINGAGKTTTIRHLMGFLRPQRGKAIINGMDCWKKSAEIKRLVGYVPGEIAFPDAHTGWDFLHRQAELQDLTDFSRAEELVKQFQLDPSANLKRMSKGMKQKTALVAAFMTSPSILILDEPTTGLDPLMRAEFVDLINEEKKNGTTILMSSHMFEELEDTCDKVALIKEGRIASVKATSEIKHNHTKSFKIEFHKHDDCLRFLSAPFRFEDIREERCQVIVHIHDEDINLFIKTMKGYDVKFISEIKYTLEDYFKSLY